MGGLDIDSPYTIKTTPLSPQYFPGEVATPGPPNGSPIGFRTAQVLRTSPGPGLSIPAQSGLFPICDPNDINDNCKVGAYLPMFQSGQIYVVARAEDGDHTIDRRIPDARLLVQSYDNDSATPYERTLRKKVLVFHVNKPPFFQLNNPLFQPLPARVDTFTTNLWHMELYADDEDPFLAGTPVGVPQQPNQPKTLRRRITILGVNSQGDSLRFNDGQSYFDPVVNYFIPPATDLRAGRAIVSVELCDCSNCDNTYGGRCVTLQIPVEYRPSGPLRTQRPGSGGLSSRSEGP
jgi:hypothetical protein